MFQCLAAPATWHLQQTSHATPRESNVLVPAKENIASTGYCIFCVTLFAFIHFIGIDMRSVSDINAIASEKRVEKCKMYANMH